MTNSGAICTSSKKISAWLRPRSPNLFSGLPRVIPGRLPGMAKVIVPSMPWLASPFTISNIASAIQPLLTNADFWPLTT